MNIRTDEKFRFVHMKLGIKQDYSNLIKENNFTDLEVDILHQASIDINSPEPNNKIIFRAYNILHPKKVQNPSIKNKNTKKYTDTKNSKLMQCSVCKGKIASTADICPHCGAVNEATSDSDVLNTMFKIKDWKVVVIITIIVIIGVKLVYNNAIDRQYEEAQQANKEYMATHSPEQIEKAKKAKALQRKYYDAIEDSMRYLKSSLRDPDSYESIEWSPLVENDDGTYGLRHTYRARNGFGGMNVETKTFLFSSNGSIQAVR